MGLSILHLISSSGFFGAENVALELATEQKSMGHNVTIGVFNNLHNPNLELKERASVRSIGTRVFDCRGKLDFKTVAEVRAFTHDNAIDIIHSHGYKSNIYVVLSNISNSRPIVTTCHNWINASMKMGIYTLLDKLFLKMFDAVVAVSEPVKGQIIRAGIMGKRVHLIENGINITRFLPTEEVYAAKREFGSGKKVIGTIGRLTVEKGHTYLIRAAKRVIDSGYDCKFVIVGDGNLRYQLEEEAASLGIGEKVMFTGNRTDIPELLSTFDIFVLPSLLEGQPMALFEAMAAKRPIVATDVGDVKKILRDGKVGVVVQSGNYEALAMGIMEFLDTPETAIEKGALGYTEVVRSHSSSRMAQEYTNVYKSIMK